MPEFSYEIIEELGTISEGKGGWIKELNLISWNGTTPKYDIRDWSPEREKMSKGITLSKEDAIVLRDLLNKVLTD